MRKFQFYFRSVADKRSMQRCMRLGNSREIKFPRE